MVAEQSRLVLMTTDTVGGVWHHALELARALIVRGSDVALATMGGPLNATQRAQVAGIEGLPVYDSSFRLEWMDEPWDDITRAGEWLLRLEEYLCPQVVHLNQFAFGSLPFAAPRLVVAHSCVCSWWRAVHGRAAPREWRRYRDAVEQGLDGADIVAAPTRAMLETLRENYGYAGPGLAIPNGRSAADYAAAAKEPVILAAGRLWDAAKNLAALEAVAPRLRWPVVVAGSQVHPDGGVRQARGVLSLGELAPHALARHYARASIYALPARYEPFGLTALEAALAGCALVLGDIPTLREVWCEAALYVPPDDHPALKEALSRLIADASLRTTLARAARRRALEYTPERMARGYERVYAALAGDAGYARAGRKSAAAQESRQCAS
ncbi:MAG TPA: glycosyltransferase family 4 protein [Burkholderiales bacterium]|nr:glycosyltransferase family 4 protein [Burkholderiales bacterium]